MRTKIYKGEEVTKLKELLDKNTVDYFFLEYNYGGLMYDVWDGGFALPYTSRELISSGFLGMNKKYKYEVDTVKLIREYLSGEPCNFYGRRDIDIIRDIYKAIAVIEAIGGELELNIREFSVVRDIIVWKDKGNGKFFD